MGTIAIINAISISRYAFKPFDTKEPAYGQVLAYAEKLPDVFKCYIFTNEEDLYVPQDTTIEYSLIYLEAWNNTILFKQIHYLTQENLCDAVFYFFGDTPFLDSDLSSKMYRNHFKYFSEYTFADGYPIGIAPEIIKPDVLPSLKKIADNNPISRDSLFKTIQKDINAFDLETEISKKDYRMLRLVLAAENKRNYLLLSRLMEHSTNKLEDVLATIDQKPELLRTLPAYFNIQIVDACLQRCHYCPYPKLGGDILTKEHEMSPDEFRKIIREISDFSEEGYVSLSLWGEAALHSRIMDLVASVLDQPGLHCVIETSGLGWQTENLSTIKELSGRERILWIVSLDAYSPEAYRKMRGEGFDEAQKTLSLLRDLFPGQVYVQAVRATENEDDLEQFFRYWKEQTDHIIIQKYDNFCGVLPDKKVTDLSPVIRFPCWHIKRDLYVLVDGTVLMCREDLRRRYVWGNIFREPLETIWARGQATYRSHLNENYPELCEKCDEYYTYNF